MSSFIWRKSSKLLLPELKRRMKMSILNSSFRKVSNLVHTRRSIVGEYRKNFKKPEATFHYSTNSTDGLKSITTSVEYEEVAEETLQSIGDRFEELLEDSNLNDWDVTYSNDVLTVSLNKYGTYVINKQSPNKQIWLSSPFSGPKRYDYVSGVWIYKHDGKALHQLLSDEISDVVEKKVNFLNCAYSCEK